MSLLPLGHAAFTGKSGRLLRGTANRLWGVVTCAECLRQIHFQVLLHEWACAECLRQIHFQVLLHEWEPKLAPPLDTGQKETLDKKDGRRMSFQKPEGTIEYTVESRDSLNSIALKCDTTPSELVQLNKLFSRAVVPGQILYVPDPDYISSVKSSPSLISPISPLSPTSSEAEVEKSSVTNDPDGLHLKEATAAPAYTCVRPTRVVSSTSEEEEAFTEKFLKINCISLAVLA